MSVRMKSDGAMGGFSAYPNSRTGTNRYPVAGWCSKPAS
jgi:hypothetical protein